MTKRWMIALVMLSGCGMATWSQAKEAGDVRLVQTIPLPKVNGRIDHMTADVRGKRLFIAALGNNTVEMIDLANGKYVGRIEELREPQGVLFLPEQNRLMVASGEDGTCRIYNGRTHALEKTVHFKKDADNLRYDEKAKRIYVGYGDGALGVIDTKTWEPITHIPLAGHPEAFSLETRGQRIFVNVPSARQVAVVDRAKNKVIETWPLTQARNNFPMALDETHHRLFVGCRNPAKLVVLNADTGQTVALLNIPGDCDDVFYDTGSRRIYVSGGSGSILVIQCSGSDDYRIREKLTTATGARTSLFVPELKSLYVAIPNMLFHRAEIQVYTIK